MPEGVSTSAPAKTARLQRRPDGKLLGASNKTLMRMLKAHLPLAGKTLKITRTALTLSRVALLWALRELIDWS
jgi:hypothetical protein